MLLTTNFWRDSLERALRTFAQTALAGFGGASLNIWTADWKQITGLAAGASVIAILMCIDRSGATPTTPQAVVTCGDRPR